jgi:hypothetical protein
LVRIPGFRMMANGAEAGASINIADAHACSVAM